MTDKHEHERGAPDKKRLSLNRNGDDSAPKLEERLHKVLAQAGLGSRRALEERINHGVVTVNGEVATIGQSIRSGDRVELDGKVFVASALNEPARVLIYNKPEGEVTTREDPEGRPTIFEALPNIKGARWIAVGRLDINTTGLLLLTTDGELANTLMHPSREVEREYVCRIHGEVPDNIIDRLKRGVALDDGPAKFDEIEPINSSDAHAWFRVVVREGRNREVRRLWESQGFQVSRLKRIRYGSITLPRLLKRGQSQELPLAEVETLQRELGLEGGAQVLTLQPVIGQRKAGRAEIRLHKDDRHGRAFVNGALSTADEGRELRRFDHVREDRPRGGRPGHGPRRKPHGGPHGNPRGGQHAAHGRHEEQPPASYSHDRPARGPGGNYRGRPNQGGAPHTGAPRHAGKPYGQGRPPRHGGAHAGNSTEFRSWYVPDGVDTGPRRGPGPQQRHGQGRPHGGRPQGGPQEGFRDRGGARSQGPRGFAPRPHFNDARGDRPRFNEPRGDRPHGGMPRGPQGPRGGARHEGGPPRGPHHRDHAAPQQRGQGTPQNARPHGPRRDRQGPPRGPRYEGLPRDED